MKDFKEFSKIINQLKELNETPKNYEFRVLLLEFLNDCLWSLFQENIEAKDKINELESRLEEVKRDVRWLEKQTD